MVKSAKVLEETIETLKKIDTVKQICKLWNSNWDYPTEKAWFEVRELFTETDNCI